MRMLTDVPGILVRVGNAEIVTPNDLGFDTSYVVDSVQAASFTGATPVTPLLSGGGLRLTLTNGGNFTLGSWANPGAPGVLFLTVRNASGGAAGTITFPSTFHLAGAWVQPANGFNRSLVLCQIGTEAYELYRTAADVPN